MGLPHSQLIKIPIAIYSPFFPKSAALGIEAEGGLGLAQKIQNPELDSWRFSRPVGKKLKQKLHSWSRTKRGIERWCKTLQILGTLRQHGGNAGAGNTGAGNSGAGNTSGGNTSTRTHRERWLRVQRWCLVGPTWHGQLQRLHRHTRVPGADSCRENRKIPQNKAGTAGNTKRKTGRSGRGDVLRECRDASHRTPPCHEFIPWSPTTAQVYPKGSHHGTAPPGQGSAPWPFLSQQRHRSLLCWALGSKHGNRGKILKGRNLKKKNSLNPCFRIPLPSLMTQRKMSKGFEQGSERERGSRCQAPSIPGFVPQMETDPWASWARWGDPKTASTSIPLEGLTLDPSQPWAPLTKGTGNGNSFPYLHYYSRE